MRTSNLAVVVTAVALVGTAAHAAPRGATQRTEPQAAGDVCPADDAAKLRAVLSELHDANQNEIKEAKAATGRAQAPEIKQYAETMITQHTDADRLLTDLASKKSIDLSEVSYADPAHAAAKAAVEDSSKELDKRKSAAFDAAHIVMQVGDHAMFLRLVEQAEKLTKDADVTAVLDQLRRTGTQHRDEAVRLLDRVTYTAEAIGGGPSAPGSVEPQNEAPRTEPGKEPNKEAPAAPGRHRRGDAGVGGGPKGQGHAHDAGKTSD